MSSISDPGLAREAPGVVLPPPADEPEWLKLAADAATSRFRQLVEGRLAGGVPVGPGELLDWECSLHAEVSRECLDPLTAAVIAAAHDEPAVLEPTEAVKVTLLGGSEQKIRTPYFLERKRNRDKQGEKRKKGHRKKEGSGVYPILAVLGIHNRVSPALASDVGRMMAMSTEAEVVESLALRGIQMGRKRVVRIARRLARRGLKHRQARIARTEQGARGSGCVQGGRLVLGTDGGRLRTRKNRKSGRRRRSGRRGFDAEWKEPKVLVVYEIDGKGRKKKRGVVYYDATMMNADGLFAILTSLLREIGAHQAREWIIVGDGAAWIWDRIPKLIEDVGYDPQKVTEVVDFYHAAEKLYEIASLRSGWSEAQRQTWARTMRRHLKRGNVHKVIEEGLALAHGRNKKQIRDALKYFLNHRHRMKYDVCRKKHIPMGSGAVESCVRRTINLRFKSNGIFWLEESAEGLLHMRAQLLSGHWTDHVRTVLQPEAFWSPDAFPDLTSRAP